MIPRPPAVVSSRTARRGTRASPATSGRRESEFLGVIRLLRELVNGLRGDASKFRDDLRRSSERVAELTRLEDIRVLRQALNPEVEQPRHRVEQGKRCEASRMAGVDGLLRTVVASMTDTSSDTRERAGCLLARAALLADLAATAQDITLVVARIDPNAIIDGHEVQVLERVVIAVAQLLKGTFGKETKVYRSGTQCVALFLPGVGVRSAAQQLRKVQVRVAAEYEYERLRVTRRVVFTFSDAVTQRGPIAGRLDRRPRARRIARRRSRGSRSCTSNRAASSA